jgi:hypothetical protein
VTHRKQADTSPSADGHALGELALAADLAQRIHARIKRPGAASHGLVGNLECVLDHLAENDPRAAYAAGRRAGLEAGANICAQRAAKVEEEAARCEADEPGEAVALRAMAWKLDLAGAAIRALQEG